jgi:3,4-dihydroxy 2-butanone 4-phosphate synthase / GTP cyclohydrolase II
MDAQFLVKSSLPCEHGSFDVWAFGSDIEQMPHVVMTSKNLDLTQPINMRIHSECMTGDVFGSKRCDCGQQLHNALSYIEQNSGVLIYLRQEGRGIGLVNKLKAYNLQDQGMDTIEANEALGFQPDQRLYDDAIAITLAMGISRVRLISNNPQKLQAFEQAGIEVVDRIYLPTEVFPENDHYLKTKINRMGHQFS